VNGDVHHYGDPRQQRQIDRTERQYRTVIANDLDQGERFGLPRIIKMVMRHDDAEVRKFRTCCSAVWGVVTAYGL
jgi:hypothetical protein